MKRFDLKSLSLGMIVGAVAVLGIAAANDGGATGTEYRVVFGGIFEGQFQKSLSDAAEQGWKLEESDMFADRHAYAVMSRAKK